MEAEPPAPPQITQKEANPPTRLLHPQPVTKPDSQIKNPKSQPSAGGGREESKEDLNSLALSMDGKMSALIPILNIPISGCTICISLPWKTTADVALLALSQNWTQLSAARCSSLAPQQSLSWWWWWPYIPLGRQGYREFQLSEILHRSLSLSSTFTISNHCPAASIRLLTSKSSIFWKNHSRVEEILARNKVTVMFSNSKSTRGDPVTSRYILLKALVPLTSKKLKKQAPRYDPPLFWYLLSLTHPFRPRYQSSSGTMRKKLCPFSESDVAFCIGRIRCWWTCSSV